MRDGVITEAEVCREFVKANSAPLPAALERLFAWSD
jgi:hypothetical protein